MGTIEKINFPFFLEEDHKKAPSSLERTAVLFGADFYNLPNGSNRKLFIKRSNEIISFIRKNLPAHKLLYQPHPNETDEYTYLDLEGFIIGKNTIAELFLYNNADKIDYVFSICSGASISAYSMGFKSFVFLDMLFGIIPNEAIIGYRSYFGGLPNYFFIKSFNQSLLDFKKNSNLKEEETFNKIKNRIGDVQKIWVLANDPAHAMRASIILKKIKKEKPHIKTVLLMISHRRWNLINEYNNIFTVFDEKINFSESRVWYSGRPKKILEAFRSAFYLKKISFSKKEALISFAYMNFEENCILSFFSKLNKIFFLENRWYHFVYEENGGTLSKKGIKIPFGVRVFNFFVEPVLGLYSTIFWEYKDGKVLNFFRYKKSLEEVYDSTFVIMPGNFN